MRGSRRQRVWQRHPLCTGNTFGVVGPPFGLRSGVRGRRRSVRRRGVASCCEIVGGPVRGGGRWRRRSPTAGRRSLSLRRETGRRRPCLSPSGASYGAVGDGAAEFAEMAAPGAADSQLFAATGGDPGAPFSRSSRRSGRDCGAICVPALRAEEPALPLAEYGGAARGAGGADAGGRGMRRGAAAAVEGSQQWW